MTMEEGGRNDSIEKRLSSFVVARWVCNRHTLRKASERLTQVCRRLQHSPYRRRLRSGNQWFKHSRGLSPKIPRTPGLAWCPHGRSNFCRLVGSIPTGGFDLPTAGSDEILKMCHV